MPKSFFVEKIAKHWPAACVPYLVGAFRTGREAHNFAGIDHTFAFGHADRRLALEGDQPLLVGPFEVVRASPGGRS
jgi:hypothetical protein